jgi:hypothetical protein
MRLNSFVEYIHPECYQEDIPETLNVKAVKIDGPGTESLKYILTNNSIKSCDYLKLKIDTLFFIEFSCLNSQLENLNNFSQYIDRNDISEDILRLKSFKKMYPQPLNVIESEISEKIAQSIILYDIMKKECNLEKDSLRIKKFLVGICSERPSDVQIFDIITRKLRNRYKDTFERVGIVSYKHIESIFI